MNDGQKANTRDIERLVKASQAGDRNAFDKLVRLYQRRVMRMAVRMLGNANEAAEVVQAGFVKAYLGIGKLRNPKRFEVWLLRIVANAAISRARAAKRRAEKVKVAGYYENKKKPLAGREGQRPGVERSNPAGDVETVEKRSQGDSTFGIEGFVT